MRGSPVLCKDYAEFVNFDHQNTVPKRLVSYIVFNIGPEFVTAFAVSILVGGALMVKTGDELRDIDSRLGKIRDERGQHISRLSKLQLLAIRTF